MKTNQTVEQAEIDARANISATFEWEPETTQTAAGKLSSVEHQRDRLIEELERWQHAYAKLENENERLRAECAVLAEAENQTCEHGSTRTEQGDLICNACGLNLNSP